MATGRQDVADEYELPLSYFPNLDLEPVSKEVLWGCRSARPVSAAHP
jgi:hypothetical protein